MVLVIPLLALGFLTAKFLLPYERFVTVLCMPAFAGGTENCRNVGPLNGALYEHVKKDFNAWFDVRIAPWDSNATITYYAGASNRMVTTAEIHEARPFYWYGSDVANYMRGLAGKIAVIQLGIEGGRRSMVEGDQVFLYCNSLNYDLTSGSYWSDCFGNGWGGPVTFTVAGRQDRAMLDQLQAAIGREIERKEADYQLYQVVVYPIFLYAFLVLSALAWLTMKAVLFVRAG
ncbi:hypothetical protein [Pararoseomonas baculiformis]|nr:hypothetical protein [Pararoseomonas baculiformis]